MQKYQWPTDWPPCAKRVKIILNQYSNSHNLQWSNLSTGKYSEEQDKVSANSVSQDKHWIPSKTTEDPRGPDKA